MIADLFAKPRGGGSMRMVNQPRMPSPNPEKAKTLSSVYAAVDIRANAMAVMPSFVMNTVTKEHVAHPILDLLSVRPNEAMTPFVRKYLLEASVLITGNAYDWIRRDPVSMEPVELIPLPGNLVTHWMDSMLHEWYDLRHPVTGEILTIPGSDICHYKGHSTDGFDGVSVLSYAADTVRSGLAASEFNSRYYESGGHPSGVLTVDGDLSGYVNGPDGKPSQSKKDAIRSEWEKIHSGAGNSHRIAVLDLGLKYQPLAISQKDSMFIESANLSILDIARFFGVPAYKLQAGNQSYNANEQQAIEFMNQMQPRVTQNEEEQTYKLLCASDQRRGLEIRTNMMALLRADGQSRAAYYKSMWETGAYSVNDILDLEDRPAVDGGDEHNASLNYVPLSVWRDLSIRRNGGEQK